MTSFISINNNVVTIDATFGTPEKTKYWDGTGVQLRRARIEESGFNWFNRKITEVVINKITLSDSMDIACLNWFIETNIKVDLSNSFVSPLALNEFIEMCETLKLKKIKVVDGSSIRLPHIASLARQNDCEKAVRVSQEIGFKTIKG